MHIKPPHFIIVTDRGALRAGWIQPAPHALNATSNLKQAASLHRPPSIHWVEDLAFVHPRQHLTEQVTDMAGAYSAAESAGGYSGGAPRRMPSSYPDTHWKTEADRHAVEDLAGAVVSVLTKQKPEAWSLSAPVDIHNALLEALPRVCKGRLVRLLPKNLARSTQESILAHFLAE